jgi:hypothetical protein
MKARAVAAAVLLSVHVTVAANAQETGSVCFAPVKEPTPGMKSLYNDTGGNPDPDYTIQFDLRAPVQMPRGAEPSKLVEGLDVSRSHRVRVRHKGKQIESFRFRFEAGETRRCLFLNELYLTWQLWPYGRQSPWCKCGPADPARK